MGKRKILVYLQDQGGAQYLVPVIEDLISAQFFELVFIFHPQASKFEEKLSKLNIKIEKVSFPFCIKSWKDWILNREIYGILATSSSSLKDRTNLNLIEAAKSLRVKVISVLDHWKGFKRFYNGTFHVFPDLLFCIDENSRRELLQLGAAEKSVIAVGHPHLERLKLKVEAFQNFNRPSVLLVSQPIEKDGDFSSLFFEKYNGERLIDYVIRVCGVNPKNIFIKYHPKDQKKIDDQLQLKEEKRSWEYCLRDYDHFVGFNSMGLIEAFLLKKRVLCLEGEFITTDYGDITTRYYFGKTLSLCNQTILKEELPTFDQSTNLCLKWVRDLFVEDNKYI